MKESLKEQIKVFVLKGVDEQGVDATPSTLGGNVVVPRLEEQLIEPRQDPFWDELRKTGTELWLDTGDIDEAEKIWSGEMTALTTNNTLVNKEIQKGIYDSFIAEAKEIVKSLPLKQQIIEIAFILNARHGLRLAKKFGGFVSVELHTDMAHDLDATIDYGKRYFEICPDQFIVKVPYTPTGLIAARKLRESGVRINFTLEFSARQNVMVAAVTKPNYTNVFLGRIGAYIKDNGLGDGTGLGERAVMGSQKWIKELTKNHSEPTKLIAASLRSYQQIKDLAGVDVFTMPTKIASEGKANLDGNFRSMLEEDFPVGINEKASNYFPEKLWDVADKEVKLAKNLDDVPPEDGDELVRRAHEYGCADMFPRLDDHDYDQISKDGKIPKHEHWADRIAKGELAIDTLLNLAGLASFASDQKQLDERIKGIIE